MLNKLKIGLFSLTGCEGCYFAILDCPKEFLELSDRVEIKQFRLFEDDQHIENEKYDISFIEGSPLTKENIAEVKKIRKNSKALITLGACSHMGGIYHMKKYHDKIKLFEHVYRTDQGIDNLDPIPVEKIVKVDASVPGCPSTAYEFFSFLYQLIIDKNPKIKQNPVCYECQINGNRCVLQKGEFCLGPITQGGCGAVCLKSQQGCWGCRGLVEDAEVSNLVKKLKENYSDKEITRHFEIFGIKEQINL